MKTYTVKVTITDQQDTRLKAVALKLSRAGFFSWPGYVMEGALTSLAAAHLDERLTAMEKMTRTLYSYPTRPGPSQVR